MSIKVLIIEDDEDDFIIVKHYLSKIRTVEYEVFWSNNYDFAVEDILADEHDIYLIDQFLGKGEGIEIIEQVRNNNVLKPLILLTGAGDFHIDEKAMEKGASDFIVKNEIKVDTLERSLRYALERYHQQHFIRNQEKKYRSLFELSMEPLAILDHDFKIIEFNNAFQTSFQSFEKDVFHTDFSTFFKYKFDFDSIKEKVLTKGYVKSYKTTLVGQDKLFVVIISIAKLPVNSHGDAGCFQLVINDISKLMEAQNELQKMEKLSMTGRMARMIAHEVRNPLTNINLSLGELDEVTDNIEEARIYKEMIARNSKRISTLIDDLLKSTKPQELELVSINLLEIVDRAIKFCQDRIALQGVEFKKVFPDEEIFGKWDPEKLKIAFVNMMINAIEAMVDTPKPKLMVIVSKENNQPTVYIKDNGKGMDEETISNIFDPFFTNRKDGLGLGMTATLNIISMHKGKITIKSSPNKGTEFKIVL